MHGCKIFNILAMGVVAASARAADSVTLSMYARPLSEVLAKVEQATGLDLDASVSLRGQPVFIDVKNMPAKVFFERLKKITDAEWEKRGDTLVLTRSAHREKLALDAEARDRAPRVAEGIRKFLEANKGREDWSDTALQERVKRDVQTRQELAAQLGGRGLGQIMTMSTNGDSPATSVLYEALRRVPATTFASVQPGKKLVLSSSPNRLQQALPYNPAKTIEQFLVIQNKIAAAVEAAGGNSRDARITTDLSNGRPVQRVAEMILAITRQPGGEGLSVVAYLVAPNGDIVAQPRAWIMPEQASAGVAPIGTDQTVTLSKESVTLLQLLKVPAPMSGNMMQATRISFMSTSGSMMVMGSDDSRRVTPPAELAAKLSKPTEFDPLSFVVGEMLSGLAAKTGKQLMATVPDSILGSIASQVNGSEVNMKALWSRQSLGLTTASDENGWLIHPRLFAEADRQRVNRAALEKLINSPQSLGDTARYATVMSDGWGGLSLDYLWLKLMAFASHKLLDDGQKRPFVKVYGHLPENSRQPALGRTASLTVNQMEPESRRIVEDLILQGGAIMFGDGVMMVSAMGGPQRDRTPEIISAEATEAFPNGIDGRARLDINVRAEEAIYAVDQQGAGEFLFANNLGFRLGVPPGTPGFGSPPSYKEYQIADARLTNMQIFIGPTARNQATLEDWSLRKPAAKYSLETLPANLKEQIEAGRKMASNMNLSGFRGGPPPTRPPQP